MTKRMIIVLALCALVFGAVFGGKAMMTRGMNQFVDSMPVPPATVSASAVREMTWDNKLEAIGTLVPVNGTDVTAEVGGIVTQVLFESGRQVEKGARLLNLDSASELGELNRLKANAELSELNRVRREKLFKLEAIAKSDYDAAVSEANAAKAAIQSQSALLAKKDIRAPFSGQLGIRRVTVGEYLQPGTAIVTLQSVDPIEFDFELPEQYVGVVQPGFKVAVSVESYQDQQFDGAVLAIEPRVDVATRNFKLRARMPNPDHKLTPGQFGRVKLALPGERHLLVVPRTAISYSSYGSAVFVIEKKPPPAPGTPPEVESPPMPGMPPMRKTDLLAKQRFVKLGEVRGDFVAVLDGLKPGEQVATSGLLKLRNDQPVIVDNSIQPGQEMNPKPAES
jgi:membrane fusion protein (multidrug efflux system)